jgi:hypothetical protein
MTDVITAPVTSGYNINRINSNFDALRDSINEDIIHSVGGNNVMNQDLDINSNSLLNIGTLEVDNIIVGGQPLTTSEFVLGPNTVGTNELKNDAVTEAKIDPAYTESILAQVITDFTPPDIVAPKQPINDALSLGVLVTWYATPEQLAIDATDATQKAINYAISSGRGLVYFPGGITYNYPASSPSINPGDSDITLYGDGQSSLIRFEEGTGVGDINTQRKCLFKNTSSIRKGELEFRNLRFRGYWSDKGWAEGGGAVMFLNFYSKVTITGCRFENLSWMATVYEWINCVRVSNNVWDTVCRDMCRFRSSFDIQVVNNLFRHGDDDAVALHSNASNSPSEMREGIIVSDNIFEDVPAIDIIAGRMVSVHNNILRRCKGAGITVYTSTGVASEAPHSIFGISICNNQIYDLLSRAPFTTPISQAIAVIARAAQGSTATASIIPGQLKLANGVAVLPWTQRNGSYEDSDAIPPPYYIRIQNNTLARTLPAVSSYTDWGYGPAQTSAGPVTSGVTDVGLRPTNFLSIDGNARNAIISGNQAAHIAGGFVSFTSGTSSYALDEILVSDNQVQDCMGSFVGISAPSEVRVCGLSIINNNFDGDPYMLSSNRFSSGGVFNGTWIADTDPSFVGGTSYYGLRIEGNHIQNVARVVSNGGSNNIEVHRNILRCEPNAEGFSTLNKGIGNCPAAGVQYRYEIVYSDPTSAFYRNVLNTCLQVSGTMPTSGKYVRGTFVQAVSGTGVLGWQRLTTGTSHVAGTDWKTVALT